jgi:hypothetical protein
MAHFSAHKGDPLLEELHRYETQLNAWLNSAPANAILFVENPVSALRAANLGIAESVLTEFEEIMNGIAQKLGAA